VAASTQIVGVLLVFAADGGTGGSRAKRDTRLSTGVLLAAVFALAQAWIGLTLAYYTDWPTSFWITMLAAAVYGLSLLDANEWVRAMGRKRNHALPSHPQAHSVRA